MSNYSDSSFNSQSANTSWYKAFHSIPDNSTVLDVGCSSGNFGVELIKRKNCIVDGIEVFSSDAKVASKKLRKVYELNIETNDLSTIPDKYDILYFGDVIEHLATPAESLKKIKNLLNPNGKIVFSIPNMAYVGIRLEMLSGNFNYTETGLLDKTHLHFYTLEEIERTFNEAGLEIEKLDYVKKDYPNKVIEKELKKLGLNPTKKFYDYMSHPEASAFQFVGSVVRSKNTQTKKINRAKFGPVDLFETYLNDLLTNHKLETDRLETENTNLKDELVRINKNPAKFIAGKIKRRIKRNH